MYRYTTDEILKDISSDSICERYGDANIFKLIFGFKPVIGEYYVSPFRKDSGAGTWFTWHQGRLIYTDFGDSITHRGCILAVMEYYKLSYLDAIFFITKNVNQLHKEEKEAIKKEISSKQIEVFYKNLSSGHKKYWSQYGITSAQLKEDEIKAVKAFQVGKKFVMPFHYECVYAITEWENAVKICRTSQKGFGKWWTNCTKNHIGNLKHIDYSGDNLVITKSYKDCRVLKNAGVKNIIWLQSEMQFPSNEKLFSITTMYKNINILFDNDIAGIKGAKKLEAIISNHQDNVNTLILPTQEKDSADIRLHKGETELKNILSNFKLIKQ